MKVQRQVPQSKWRGDETVEISQNSVQLQNGGFQLSNREQMPQEQFQRVQKKIEIRQLQLAQEEMRSHIGRTARGHWKRPSKSEILPFRLLSGSLTGQPELGAPSARFERSSLPPRSSRQWRCRRKPNTANVRRSCRVKESSRAKPAGHEESNKIARVLNSNRQFKILEHSTETEAHKTSQ